MTVFRGTPPFVFSTGFVVSDKLIINTYTSLSTMTQTPLATQSRHILPPTCGDVLHYQAYGSHRFVAHFQEHALIGTTPLFDCRFGGHDVSSGTVKTRPEVRHCHVSESQDVTRGPRGVTFAGRSYER